MSRRQPIKKDGAKLRGAGRSYRIPPSMRGGRGGSSTRTRQTAITPVFGRGSFGVFGQAGASRSSGSRTVVMRRLSRGAYDRALEGSWSPVLGFYERHMGVSQRKHKLSDLEFVKFYDFAPRGSWRNEKEVVDLFERTDLGRRLLHGYGVMPEGFRTDVDAVPLQSGFACVDFKVDFGSGEIGLSKTQAEKCFLFVFKKRNNGVTRLDIYRHPLMRGELLS